MNISAIDYKENVTIARLQKRYLPKRFVPNYSNCLLQKEISSDAFLLKNQVLMIICFLGSEKEIQRKKIIKSKEEKKKKL